MSLPTIHEINNGARGRVFNAKECLELMMHVDMMATALLEAENVLVDYIPTIEKTGASLNYGHAVLTKIRGVLNSTGIKKAGAT